MSEQRYSGAPPQPPTKTSTFRMIAAISVAIALAAAYWLLHDSGVLSTILDGSDLRRRIVALGAAGPLVIVALMVLAILVSPIPSAPIAVAAGAVYGHSWGTLYVLLGAELGALAAFGLSRALGREVLQRWLGNHLPVAWLGTQNVLMTLVFTSRLVPFISFDVVSYAAGLTAISYWRFALATLAGIVPASFLLAHFGSEMAAGELATTMYTLLALGLVMLAPVVVQALRRRRRQRRDSSSH